MTTSLGLVDAFEKAAQMSSVAPEHAPEPSSRRLGGVATLAASTHKEKRPAGYPADRRVTLGGAQCACVANAPVAQLPLVSEPAHTGLGQMSRAEGDTARDAVPAPPGRAAGGSTPSVRVTRDTRAEGSSSEPGTNGFGPSSSMAGETLPIPRDAAGAVLDAFPAYSNPRVSGLTVHRGRVVAARAATDSEPRLGEAS